MEVAVCAMDSVGSGTAWYSQFTRKKPLIIEISFSQGGCRRREDQMESGEATSACLIVDGTAMVGHDTTAS